MRKNGVGRIEGKERSEWVGRGKGQSGKRRKGGEAKKKKKNGRGK